MYRYESAFLLALAVLAVSGCSESANDRAGQQAGANSPVAAATGLDSETEIVTVSEGTNLALALSPDGERLVISLQGVLFTLPVAGGTAVAITDVYHDAREPAWSADGTRIVFQGYRMATGTCGRWLRVAESLRR